MRRKLECILLALAVCAAIQPAEGQVVELDRPPVDRLSEGYEATRLSSSTLVSIHLGAPSAVAASDTNFTVPNPQDLSGDRQLCVDANSRDGLFWSRHIYDPQPGADGWRVPSLTYRYARELSDYQAADILIVTRLGADIQCASDPVYLPAVFEAEGPLFIDLNSRDRVVEAQIAVPNGAAVRGDCERRPTTNLISDQTCRFALSEELRNRHLRLEVTFIDFPFGEETREFQVFAPASLPGQ